MLTTLSERRVLQHPLYHAIPGVTPLSGELWTPDEINCLVWYDASDTTTITQDGNNLITQWKGVGGSLNPAVASGNACPTYVANSLNGKSGILGDSSKSFTLTRRLTTVREAYVVYNITNYNNSNYLLGDTIAYDWASTNTGFVLHDTYANSFIRGGSGWVNGAVESPANMLWRLNNPTIYEFSTTGNVVVGTISADRNIELRSFNGTFYEIILRDTVSTPDERQKIEGYLAHKWGLTTNLPINHPYKVTPPLAEPFTPKPPTTWWLAGGISPANCVMAYQAIGVKNLRSTYTNLANPGTYNITSGVGPYFNKNTGWIFNGTQYLNTGHVPKSGQDRSLIIRFSNASLGKILSGVFTSPVTGRLQLIPRDSYFGSRLYGNGIYAYTGDNSWAGPGVMAVAGSVGYKDGQTDVVGIANNTLPIVQPLPIGANITTDIDAYYVGNIQAFAYYDTTLNAAQVAAVTAAMNAL